MNTFYHGDCKFVMEHDIPKESVDLIYLDPPFFTGQVQKSKVKWQPGAMELSYDDSRKFWAEKGLHSTAPEWMKHIARKNSERAAFAAYLYYMMERLQACKQVLRQTGSIYLHCDWRASHYLKMVMDEIFNINNFRNEVIWHYASGGASKDRFSRKHDTLLLYGKSSKVTHNILRIPYKTSNAKDLIKKGMFNPDGKMMDDVWDISFLSTTAKERQGYPTQKPLVLLERIILASSNEDDTVLDPFCGCGTAIIAAHNLRRYWIGIDINKSAYEVTIDRKAKAAQLRQGMDDTFSYVERDLKEVKGLSASEFEKWVNKFYKATKPSPDRGVDGITQDNIPIQTKTFLVKYDIVDNLVAASKLHPLVKQPINKVIVASSVGFDDSARERRDAYKEQIEVILATPENMLGAE